MFKSDEEFRLLFDSWPDDGTWWKAAAFLQDSGRYRHSVEIAKMLAKLRQEGKADHALRLRNLMTGQHTLSSSGAVRAGYATASITLILRGDFTFERRDTGSSSANLSGGAQPWESPWVISKQGRSGVSRLEGVYIPTADSTPERCAATLFYDDQGDERTGGVSFAMRAGRVTIVNAF